MLKGSYPYTILFVEDEKKTRDNYVEYLKNYFEFVYEAEDGESAYRLYKEKKPHILILDINIPKLNGLDLLSKIREEDHTTKAIMLTAHESVDLLQQAVGLKLTKYLVKPVSRKAFHEALEAVIVELTSFATLPKKMIVLNENYSWNFETLELTNNNKPVNLTQREKKVFTYLINNVNKTCPTEHIIDEVWEAYDEGNVNSLKTAIKDLRKKLPKQIIQNIFGIGYRIDI